MMKTPDEIKKGLEIVVNGCLTCDCCITGCPYDMECHPMNEDTNVDIPKQMTADAIAYIQQLENHIRDITKKVAQLEEAQPMWISVEVDLPAHAITPCLIYADGTIELADWSHDKYGLEWWFYVDGEYETGVTHWMALPEAPKEGE